MLVSTVFFGPERPIHNKTYSADVLYFQMVYGSLFFYFSSNSLILIVIGSKFN